MKLHRLPALLPLLASSLSAGSLLWAANAQAAAAQPADDAADAQTRCSDLKEVELPDVVIQRVKWVQRGGLAQDPNSAFTGASGQTLQAEEHCVVRGEIEPRTGADGRHYGTQFELRLPARWNHKFLFQGGGGTDGFVADALGRIPTRGSSAPPALLRGYAVVSMDGGHQGRDTLFGKDQQARLDLAYASTGKVATAARQLIQAMYHGAPKRSYFMGCSNGGREAMMAAMRYPLQFDGVVAGNPGFRLSRAAIAQSWDNQQFLKAAPVNEQGERIFANALTQKDLDAVAAGVLERCDALDGLKDGLVNAWERCDFKPRMVEKDIGKEKVALLEAVFGGARTSKGEPLYASWPWDAGINSGNWRGWKLGDSQSATPNARNIVLGAMSLPHYFMTPYQAEFDTFKVNFDTVLPLTLQTAAINDAVATDLTTFKARGGKMIIFEGVSDPVFSANDLRDWYRQLQHDTPGTQDFARLFMVPGMTHCGEGNALDDFDPLTALENWAEKGEAPASIIAQGRAFPGKTQPLCPYPQVATYRGEGDENSAESFSCQ